MTAPPLSAARTLKLTADRGAYAPLTDPTLEVTTLNDNFTRSDGAIGTDPKSGYTWAAGGGAPPTITSNRLVASAHPGTSYAQITLARAPVEMRGTLSYVAGGGTDASPSPLVLASSSIANQASPSWNLIHVQYTQSGYQIQKAIANVFTTLGTGNWTTPVPLDGTVKSVKWRLVGSTLTLTGPNGESVSVTDSDLAWLNGRYCFWSIEPQDANSPKARWQTATATEARTANAQLAPLAKDLWIPDGAAAESYTRALAQNSNLNPLASGTVYCAGITLPGGVPINWVEFFATGTAAGTPTHQWAVLMDLAGRVVAVSADLTNTAWASNTEQRFQLTSQYVPAGPMAVWVGLCVVAATVPTLHGMGGGNTGVQSYPPRPAGASSAGQTTPPAVGTILSKPAVTTTGWPYVLAG